MTESSSPDPGYWVSPFEDLAQQQDAGSAQDVTEPVPDGIPAEGMLASWYGPGFHGSPPPAASLDPYGFTAAHPHLPFGTQLDVGYAGNLVRVTVNDRGPFTGDRQLDLSEGAADALGLTDAGVDFVTVSYPGASDPAPEAPPPPVADPPFDPIIPDGAFVPGAPYEGFTAVEEPVQDLPVDPVQPAPDVLPETPPEPYAPVVDPAPPVVPVEGMLASWYGPGFHGSPTASGEPFDPYGFTAAHPHLPFGTQLDVGYAGNLVRVTVNDRGPFTGDRQLDLSEGAADALGLTDAGVDLVTVSYPGAPTPEAPPPPVADPLYDPAAYDPYGDDLDA